MKSFTKGPVNLYDWPNITSDDWSYNPLIPDKTVCVELQNAGLKDPNLYVLKEIGFTDCDLNAFAINSDGDFIGLNRTKITLSKITVSKVKVYEVCDTENQESFEILGLATDGNNITYLLLVYFTSPSGTLEPITADLVLIDSDDCSKRAISLFGYSPEHVTVNSTLDGFVVVQCRFEARATDVDFYQGADF